MPFKQEWVQTKKYTTCLVQVHVSLRSLVRVGRLKDVCTTALESRTHTHTNIFYNQHLRATDI